MSTFSERYGYLQRRTVAQVEAIDEPLLNGLWNCVCAAFGQMDDSNFDRHFVQTSLYRFGKALWHDFFKKPIDEMPADSSWNFRTQFKQWFMAAPWYSVYDFIQFVAQRAPDGIARSFVHDCSQVLTRELAGYAFVGRTIAPISSETEVAEVESALKHPLRPVSQHLSASLALLSDREQPNYRKSVDESILAVEAAARALSGKPNATLAEGLAALKVDLHKTLKVAFTKLYGYTSDASGIRHALKEDGAPIDQADARYMLVACSAFVNYLRALSKRELP